MDREANHFRIVLIHSFHILSFLLQLSTFHGILVSILKINLSFMDVYRIPLIRRKRRTQKSKKLEKVVNVTLYVYKVCSTNFIKLSKPFSQSSKLRAFHSLHRHHIKHNAFRFLFSYFPVILLHTCNFYDIFLIKLELH